MDRAGGASSRVMAATAVGSAGVRGQEGAREVETAELLVQGIARPVATTGVIAQGIAPVATIASVLALRCAMRVRLTLSATRELIEAAITLTVTPALTAQQSVVRAQ